MMQHSSRQAIDEPSQQVIDGMPKGYPPTREHLNDSARLGSDLQNRLDEIGRQNLAEAPEGSQARAYYTEK